MFPRETFLLSLKCKVPNPPMTTLVLPSNDFFLGGGGHEGEMLNIYIFVQIGSYILAKITNITTLQTFLKIGTKFVIKPRTQQENHLYSPRFKIGGHLREQC